MTDTKVKYRKDNYVPGKLEDLSYDFLRKPPAVKLSNHNIVEYDASTGSAQVHLAQEACPERSRGVGNLVSGEENLSQFLEVYLKHFRKNEEQVLNHVASYFPVKYLQFLTELAKQTLVKPNQNNVLVNSGSLAGLLFEIRNRNLPAVSGAERSGLAVSEVERVERDE